MNIQKFTTLKTILIALVFTISTNQLFAQTTNGIYFQAVARDNFSNPAKDRKIYVQSSIIQTTPTGTKVLTEEHQANTDATGVFSISLGNGVRVGGTATSLTTIDWSKGPYYLNLKVAITPIGGNSNWDYTKEWVDMGTTSFGAVPFALYSASSAKVDDKLNANDTTKMLAVYAKAIKVQSLETAVASKLTAADTLTMLAPYAKAAYTIDSSFFKSQLATKLSLTDTIKYTKQKFTDSAIAKKLNIADSAIYVTKTQLASYNFASSGTSTTTTSVTIDTTSLSNRINLKANLTELTTLNTNIASNTASITSTAAAITAEATRANAAELSLSNNILANTASITANSSNIATLNTSITTNTASITANTEAINSKAPIASPTFTGTVTAPIYKTTPQSLTPGATINWNPANGLNASVTLDQNSTLSFTSTPPSGSYGTLVITQDATGSRTITLPSTTNKVLGSTSSTTIALSTAANAKDILNFYYDGTNCYWNIGQGYGANASSSSTNLSTGVTGSLAIANGGTGATTAAAARTNLGLVIGTNVQAPLIAGTDYLAPNGSAASLTNFPTFNQNTTGNAATATLATTATTATNATMAGNITATSNTTLTSLANLTTVGTITSGTWSGTAIAVAKGGTGATNAADARTNLGLVIGINVQAPLVAGTDYQAPIILTTTGTGAATFSGTTLNIPTPSSGSSNTHSVGESYGGGVVFYTWDNGNHGLIVSTDDVSSVTQSAWPGNATIERIKPILVNNNGLLAGKELTRTLVYYALTASGITNLPTSNIAAYLCYQYRGGNFSDWYLPSAYELDLLWQNRNVVANLASTWNISTTKYWSSTLSYTDGGVNVQFYLINYLGQTNGNAAYDAHRVRAIRSF